MTPATTPAPTRPGVFGVPWRWFVSPRTFAREAALRSPAHQRAQAARQSLESARAIRARHALPSVSARPRL